MRVTTTMLALTVLLAVPLLAGDAAVDELVIEAKDHVHDYSLTPADSIGGVIEKALSGVSTAQQLDAIVRERFGLKGETARLITIATLRHLIADGAGGETQEEAGKIVADLDRDYANALRSDPANGAVAREYLALLADVDNFLPDAPSRIREVLRGLPRDRRGLVALEVMSDPRVRPGHTALFDAVMDSC